MAEDPPVAGEPASPQDVLSGPDLPAIAGSGHSPSRSPVFDRRAWYISALALGLSVVAAVLARALLALIGLVTHLAFFGELGWTAINPWGTALGPLVLVIPAAGGLIVGVMARFGSAAIRGHGIPEAMEQILTRESRIPARVLFLKPLSAAISIGTGGPFGAEGPIIASGGALGSVVGQWLPVNAHERKTLLAAGAAAGMTATFGTPLAAILLAVELLLFELRPRSLIPVMVASGTAAVVRGFWVGFTPFFAMPPLAVPSAATLLACVPIGMILGVLAVGISRGVYAVEDAFEHLPIHWMWWPALGGLVVGAIGLFWPRTLGVGYSNITDALAGTALPSALLALGIAKWASWTVSLGSGTSGGTLAPLMTVGACIGAALGHWLALWPVAGLSPALGALVGMAAVFAGASRALFMSIVFALETTWQMAGLLPVIIACTGAYLVSCLLMPNTLMTEKITRRGVAVPDQMGIDLFAHTCVRDCMSRSAITVAAGMPIANVREVLAGKARHRSYPVVGPAGEVIGLVAEETLLAVAAPDNTPVDSLVVPAVRIFDDESLQAAIERMARHQADCLVVVSRLAPHLLAGILSRSDLIRAYRASR